MWKRLAALICALAMALGMSGLAESGEAAAASNWIVDDYPDEFQRPSGDIYLKNAEPFTGTYSNGEVNDGELRADFYIDSDGFSLVLLEDGTRRVRNDTDEDRAYGVAMLDDQWQQTFFAGYMGPGDDRLHFGMEDSDTITSTLLINSEIRFYIEEDANPDVSYLVVLDHRDGFLDALWELFSSQFDGLYQEAIDAFNAGEYTYALSDFAILESVSYLDSAEWVEKCQAAIYAEAEAQQAKGDPASLIQAALNFTYIHDYEDAYPRSLELLGCVAGRDSIAAGFHHRVGLKTDGCVVAAGDNEYGQCDVSGWENIVAVSAGSSHTLGLREDGTVVAVGDNQYGQCDVAGWTDLLAIAAGFNHSVGLRADATVVATGFNNEDQCDVDDWRYIIDVAAGSWHTVGLDINGRVWAAGSNYRGQCDVNGWDDIVAVAAGNFHTLGLKADGTVVAAGYNDYGQCEVSDWTDIVAIACGDVNSVGLKADGTVVSTTIITQDSNFGQDVVSDWTDIVAISAGEFQTLGLRADGAVLSAGNSIEAPEWTDIRLPKFIPTTHADPAPEEN